MERIVFFGKGGIGKSTTASNISATLAAEGRRVLHVGCDPKHDSTVALLRGTMIEPVVDRIHSLAGLTAERVVTRSHLGVDCVEAGGPEAGVGCGGRGISRMLEIFQSVDLLSPARYDVCVYDVLGDVVCGGFASPLRKGIGEKVVIVASEEVMALYAANNIARAVVHYASNGVALAGLIVNLRDNNEDRGPVERFARLINTKVLGYIPREPLVREAEYRRMTVAEYAPGAPITRTLRELGEQIIALDARSLPLPTPLDEATFYALTQHRFVVPEGGVGAPPHRARGGGLRGGGPRRPAARRGRRPRGAGGAAAALRVRAARGGAGGPHGARLRGGGPAAAPAGLPRRGPRAAAGRPRGLMSELFPELDEDGGADEAPAAAWHPASERGLAALRQVLAVRELVPGAELARAEFSLHESTVRLVVAGDAVPAMSVSVSPRSTRPAALRTRQLNLSFQSEGAGPPPVLVQLLARLQHRLTNAPFELLLRAASLGAARREPAKPPPSADEAAAAKALPTEHRGSVAFSYRPPAGWRNFFEQKEMYRGLFHGLRGPITVVHHADIECHMSDAPRFDGSVNFLNFPRQEPWALSPPETDARLQGGSRFLLTDMDDRDVIKGADTRLEHLLARVGDPYGPADEPPPETSPAPASPGVVFVVPTCISLITGDDIDAAASRKGVRRRMPILNVGNQNDPFAAMFRLVAAEPGFRDRAPRPHRVNLVGLPYFSGRAALFELLREAGVEVGCELLPAFDLAQARDYLCARAQVLYPSDQARELHEQTLAHLPLDTVAPPPPFGVEGTRHWLAAVGAAADREAACAAAFERALDRLRPRWDALRARARGVPLGFVLDDDAAEILRDPVRMQGVPLARLLVEVGFSLEVLRYAPPGQPDPSPLAGVAERRFDSPASLAEGLRASRAAAFYSDVFFDDRLTRAGKQIFSLRDVGMGLTGAVETAERLLARCANPFLRRYGAWLSPEGA
jgi:nitrogenase iron protein NifH